MAKARTKHSNTRLELALEVLQRKPAHGSTVMPLHVAIAKATMNRSDGIDVPRLVEHLKRAGYEVSVALFYRLLPVLIEAGIIPMARPNPELGRRPAAAPRQEHLVCEGCGKTLELTMDLLVALEERLVRNLDFDLQFVLSGLLGNCSDCRRESGVRMACARRAPGAGDENA